MMKIALEGLSNQHGLCDAQCVSDTSRSRIFKYLPRTSDLQQCIISDKKHLRVKPSINREKGLLTGEGADRGTASCGHPKLCK